MWNIAAFNLTNGQCFLLHIQKLRILNIDKYTLPPLTKSIKCVVADDWKGINTRPVISTKVWSPTNEHTVNRYEMTGNFLPQLNSHIIIEIHIRAVLLTTCYIMKPVITKVIHPQSGFDWLHWLESADGFFACSSQKVDKTWK